MWLAIYFFVGTGTSSPDLRPVGEIWMPTPECWVVQAQVQQQRRFVAICSPAPVMPHDTTPDIDAGFRIR